LIVGFIVIVEEKTWFSSIAVFPKKNVNLCIYVNFRKLNLATKKDPHSLSFIEYVLDMVTGYEAYSFLDKFSSYHQIMIALEDQYKTTFIIEWGAFVWLVMPFELKNVPTYQRVINMAFKEYLGMFMKLFLDDFNIFSDLKTYIVKVQLCFYKCR
jgi:putative transposase